ncbi:MAG TPA: amidohydrolase [Fibrobacteres bacterium]|jgi:amidohydrolase|nr:amidohydrolase [Fibrobacterota bacterium]
MDSQFITLAAGCSEFRHSLHRKPELSGTEFSTREALIAELKALGFEPQTFSNHQGIVALWPGKDPSAGCVALRADMDALPLREESGLAWASQTPGVMHACGHDGHMAILLGVARWLSQRGERHARGVKLVFQPSEETGNGAPKMIADGILENPKVEAMFGLHGWPELPAGTVAVPDKAAMAGVDNFTLTLRGRGGHGAMPHLTRDPIAAAAALILAAQTLVSRKTSPLDPVVVTFGSISAGEAPNIIPETCTLRGTIRTFDPAVRSSLLADFETLIRNTSAAHGVTPELGWLDACPPTMNDPNMAVLARNAASEALGSQNLRTSNPSMGGEDFAFFLEKVPGAYFWLGLGMDRGPLHNPRFDFNDETLAAGIAVFAGIIANYCKSA